MFQRVPLRKHTLPKQYRMLLNDCRKFHLPLALEFHHQFVAEPAELPYERPTILRVHHHHTAVDHRTDRRLQVITNDLEGDTVLSH